MDVCALIKHRLDELGVEQKDLAAAARVTESYVSQLLTRKKLPPAPDRTDIYERMERFLRLSRGELSTLAGIQRREALKRGLEDPPAPLFKEIRALILRKCSADQEDRIRAIFEKEPFGELESLVTRKLLDVVKTLAREELENENWIRRVARLSRRSYEQMRVIILEFLDTDVFTLSPDNGVIFLDPLIETWRIDLTTFGMEIVLNRRLAPAYSRRFEYIERVPGPAFEEEPGLKGFLRDPSLSGGATEEEIEFLKSLRFKGRRPSPLYYYRELQNLRDPLHFSPRGPSGRRRRRAKPPG